jgi:hypothetical protein
MDRVIEEVTPMERLSDAEFRIARAMLIKEFGAGSPFLDQLDNVQVERRHLTGVGLFVDLAVPSSIAPVDGASSTVTDGYETTLGSPCDIVGFVLFIREGYLSLLEGYTFGDVRWPDKPLEEWLKIAKVEPVVSRAD